jgi:GNAT superfamily N-acetyltransferase
MKSTIIPRLHEENPSPEMEALAAGAETPDARIVLAKSNGCLTAHVALWWRETPELDGRRVGGIGGFTAVDAESARAVLAAAEQTLRDAGCRIAVGPMNGNTWRRHRFVTDTCGGRGTFLLEPRNPSEFPQWWESAGYRVLSRYSSSVIVLENDPGIPPALARRLTRSGVEISPLDATRFDEDLMAIHAVSVRSFSRNFLYTALAEDAFLGAYRKIRERVDPDLVRIARQSGKVCGFVFGIPDLEAAARGERPAVIVKTLAVDPEARCAGLGSLLVDELHRIGREKGYRESIHALQHEANTSLKITGRHHGEVLRRYALFSKPL